MKHMSSCVLEFYRNCAKLHLRNGSFTVVTRARLFPIPIRLAIYRHKFLSKYFSFASTIRSVAGVLFGVDRIAGDMSQRNRRQCNSYTILGANRDAVFRSAQAD